MKKNSLYVCLCQGQKNIYEELPYFKTFGHFDQTLLQVIEGPESESEAHFLASVSLVGSQPIRNELSYFKTFGRSD